MISMRSGAIHLTYLTSRFLVSQKKKQIVLAYTTLGRIKQ